MRAPLCQASRSGDERPRYGAMVPELWRLGAWLGRQVGRRGAALDAASGVEVNDREPVIGAIYERPIRVGSVWRWERCEVVDVSSRQVVYRLVFEPPDGTYVDVEHPLGVVSTKEWSTWRLAPPRVSR